MISAESLNIFSVTTPGVPVGEGEVVVRFHLWYPAEMLPQELCPVLCGDDHLPVLCDRKFGNVDVSGGVDSINNVLEAADESFPVVLFQLPEAPIRGELCVPNQHEGDGDGPDQCVAPP